MYSLDQAVVNLLAVMAVVLMVPWLGMLIAAMFMRQVKRFGFTRSLGDVRRYDL